MHFTFLGGFHVAHDQLTIRRFGGDKVQALLAYLVVESERSHTRAALAGLLWPNFPDAIALRNLTQSLVRLRAAFGDQADALLTIYPPDDPVARWCGCRCGCDYVCTLGPQHECG